jgi:hypothetical protein
LADLFKEKCQVDFVKSCLIAERRKGWLSDICYVDLVAAMCKSWKVSLQMFAHGTKTESLIVIGGFSLNDIVIIKPEVYVYLA